MTLNRFVKKLRRNVQGNLQGTETFFSLFFFFDAVWVWGGWVVVVAGGWRLFCQAAYVFQHEGLWKVIIYLNAIYFNHQNAALNSFGFL